MLLALGQHSQVVSLCVASIFVNYIICVCANQGGDVNLAIVSVAYAMCSSRICKLPNWLFRLMFQVRCCHSFYFTFCPSIMWTQTFQLACSASCTLVDSGTVPEKVTKLNPKWRCHWGWFNLDFIGSLIDIKCTDGTERWDCTTGACLLSEQQSVRH